MPIGDPVTDYDGLRQHDIALKTWIDDNLVHKAGTEAETIGGVKTYSSSPLVPTPADNDDSYKAANTEWVQGRFADLHLPLWVGEGDVGTEFYVDGSTGSDSTGDGSQSKPWKTLTHATEHLASNYNINNKTVHINVAAGTYSGRVSLPLFSRTTGEIVIRPVTGASVSVVGSNQTFSHKGGAWVLSGLAIALEIPSNSAAGSTPSLVYSDSQNGYINVRSCDLSYTDLSSERALPRLLYARGGKIAIENADTETAAAWSGTDVNSAATWLYADAGGIIDVRRQGDGYKYNVSGNFDTFCLVRTGGQYISSGSGAAAQWIYDGAAGKRFAAEAGGSMVVGVSAAAFPTYFPGDEAGTVDSMTNGWSSPALSFGYSATATYDMVLAEDVTTSPANPYSFSLPSRCIGARIFINMEQSTTNKNCVITFASGTKSTVVNVSSGASSSSGRRVFAEASTQNGLLDVTGGSCHSTAQTADTYTTNVANLAFLEPNTPLDSVDIYLTGDGVIPAGTRIRAYACYGGK